MVDLLKALLNRTTTSVKGMNGHRRLPGRVLDYLERKFQLHPQDMLTLRAVKRRGLLGNLPATFIRIYDQALLERNGISIKSFRDLDRHAAVLLYHGYILDNNMVHLTRGKTAFALESSQNKRQIRLRNIVSRFNHN
jgi:hypothetical protein